MKPLSHYSEQFLPDMITFLEMYRILGVEQVQFFYLNMLISKNKLKRTVADRIKYFVFMQRENITMNSVISVSACANKTIVRQ